VAELQARVTEERAIIQKMLALRTKIEEASLAKVEAVPAVQAMTGTGPVLVVPRPSEPSGGDVPGMRVELSNLVTELATLQGENPLVRPYVDSGTTLKSSQDGQEFQLGKCSKTRSRLCCA